MRNNGAIVVPIELAEPAHILALHAGSALYRTIDQIGIYHHLHYRHTGPGHVRAEYENEISDRNVISGYIHAAGHVYFVPCREREYAQPYGQYAQCTYHSALVTVLSHPVGACISRKRICQEPREYDYRSQREFYVLKAGVIQKHLFYRPLELLVDAGQKSDEKEQNHHRNERGEIVLLLVCIHRCFK